MMDEDDESLYPCPICQLHPVGRFNPAGNQKVGRLREICIRCRNKKQNELSKTLYKKPKKLTEERKCKFCNILYRPIRLLQIFCSSNCRQLSKQKEEKDKWEKKVYMPPKKISEKTKEKINRSSCYYSNPKWAKKFQTVRG
jgi:hypothetical protein